MADGINNRELTQSEIKELLEFTKSHGLTINYGFSDKKIEKLFQKFYSDNGKKDEFEQIFVWLDQRPDTDNNFKYIVQDIVAQYGVDFLSRAEIIEVGGGRFPSLSKELLTSVPQIKRIAVYDPELLITPSDLESKNLTSKLIINKRYFFPENLPLSEKKPILIIGRHPCGGTPAIFDAVRENKNVDMYTVLCPCKQLITSYYRNRGVDRPIYTTQDDKYVIFHNPRITEHLWQKALTRQLQLKRNDIVTKLVPTTYGVDGVILTNPQNRSGKSI